MPPPLETLRFADPVSAHQPRRDPVALGLGSATAAPRSTWLPPPAILGPTLLLDLLLARTGLPRWTWNLREPCRHTCWPSRCPSRVLPRGAADCAASCCCRRCPD